MLHSRRSECRDRGRRRLVFSTSELQKEALALYRSGRLLARFARRWPGDSANNKTIGGGIRRYHFEKCLLAARSAAIHVGVPLDELRLGDTSSTSASIARCQRLDPALRQTRPMNTSRLRRSSEGRGSSQAGGWKTCCTPWITAGRSGLSATLTMPFSRRRSLPQCSASAFEK